MARRSGGQRSRKWGAACRQSVGPAMLFMRFPLCHKVWGLDDFGVDSGVDWEGFASLGRHFGPFWAKRAPTYTSPTKSLQKSHADGLREIRGSPLRTNNSDPPGDGRALKTLHFVPRGHGGGYIYIYIYAYMYMYIYIYTYLNINIHIRCGIALLGRPVAGSRMIEIWIFGIFGQF